MSAVGATPPWAQGALAKVANRPMARDLKARELRIAGPFYSYYLLEIKS